MQIEFKNCSLEIKAIGTEEQTVSIDDLYESLMKVCDAIARAFSDLVEACKPAIEAWIEWNAETAPAPAFYGLHRL